MTIKTRKVDVSITELDGTIIFERKGFEVPEFWTDRAATVMANKYAAKGENSAIQIIDRVVNQITFWGAEQGYFDQPKGEILLDDEARRNFKDNLKDILINQRAAFNSPVWFNVGVPNHEQQVSACFVLPLEDDMDDILEHAVREGKIFKHGSGAGINVSKLRAAGEALSNGGTTSGPLSFMKIYDAVAGCVKSGGKTRRAAKLVCMDIDHPDIMDFIECKLYEEKKAKALIDAGIDREEAYSTIAYQNANHSIRVTDSFMGRALNGESWQTFKRGDRSSASIQLAKDILRRAAEVAWETGDPGIQFDDRMNIDNPVPSMGKINSTNPCQPEFATVLTPQGIKTFADIDIDSTIWSGKQWTKVTHKVATGTKPVFEYRTTAGNFVGTENHRVFQDGTRIEVKDAEGIDQAFGPTTTFDERISGQDVVDGWVFGDGSTHKASNNLVYLNLGKDDFEPFIDNYSEFYIKERYGLSDFAHEVETTIHAEELGYTFERMIPKRFLYGNSDKKIGFLKGLYSANGSICGGRVTLKATSFDVICDVQQMLSSIGIPSYYTTNRPKKVKFDNGEYECKQSYDLNITRGKHDFARLVGFYHPHKQEKLAAIVDTRPSCKPPKITYDIKEILELGEMPVWDIRVEAEEHSYWTGSLLVSNCSEFSAVDNSSCNLASLNLVKYYKEGWSPSLDWDLFKADIEVLITAMDIMVDSAYYPTKEIEEVTRATRPLGLGFTNLGALLMLKGLPYDSDKARGFAAVITRQMTEAAYWTSIQLGEKMGSFKGLEENYDVNNEIVNRLIKNDCNFPGLTVETLRNSQVTLLAPTGTISFMMDCDTTGIEPLFALKAYKQLAGGGVMEIHAPCAYKAFENLEDYVQNNHPRDLALAISDLPKEKRDIFATANEISWKAHIDMMAACQPHLNGAISKTVNMTADATVEDIEECYMYAWKQGIKAVAVYRDGAKDMQPMVTKKPITPNEARGLALGAMEEMDKKIKCYFGEEYIGELEEVTELTKNQKKLSKIAKNQELYDSAEKIIDSWPDWKQKLIEAKPQEQVFEELEERIKNYEKKNKHKGSSLDEMLEEEGLLDEVEEQAIANVGLIDGNKWVAVRRELSDTIPSTRHRFNIAGTKGYIHPGVYEDGSLGEVFIKMQGNGSTLQGIMDAFATAVSLALQYGVPLEKLAEKFIHSKFEPSGITTNPDIRMTSSIMDYVFRWLTQEFLDEEEEDFDHPKENPGDSQINREPTIYIHKAADGPLCTKAMADTIIKKHQDGPPCSTCGSLTQRAGTCYYCSNCGSSSGCS